MDFKGIERLIERMKKHANLDVRYRDGVLAAEENETIRRIIPLRQQALKNCAFFMKTFRWLELD